MCVLFLWQVSKPRNSRMWCYFAGYMLLGMCFLLCELGRQHNIWYIIFEDGGHLNLYFVKRYSSSIGLGQSTLLSLHFQVFFTDSRFFSNIDLEAHRKLFYFHLQARTMLLGRKMYKLQVQVIEHNFPEWCVTGKANLQNESYFHLVCAESATSFSIMQDLWRSDEVYAALSNPKYVKDVECSTALQDICELHHLRV